MEMKQELEMYPKYIQRTQRNVFVNAKCRFVTFQSATRRLKVR